LAQLTVAEADLSVTCLARLLVHRRWERVLWRYSTGH